MTRPSGTVTFLFTDIQGSTRRWEADPNAMREALAAHDEVLRVAVEAHGGWLFKHTGDGVCAAFAVAGEAVAAAVDAQRGLGLPVRMGVATGEAEVRGDDYFGPALNRAARVMAAGHGGQILVAAATAGLVSGVGLVDLGECRLRDLSGAEHLFQVRAEGLQVEFPPLRTLDVTPGNLPLSATSFVGREVEVKELAARLAEHRLVSVVGPGGMGKTRLAVEAARSVDPALFPDGSWLCELAALQDGNAVPYAVGEALGFPVRDGLDPVVLLLDALGSRRLLVVLDNCEHLLDPAAGLTSRILSACPTVTVLVTSREPLGIAGEQVYLLAPLDSAGDATSLFVERARAADSTFSLSVADTEMIERICRRLDGMPLAIELAAARVRSSTLTEIAERLEDRFRLLRGAGRDRVERHRTLWATVEWSHELLDLEQRAVFEQVSVFVGGFTLAAAETICMFDGEQNADLDDLLAGLVDKSLVLADRGARTTRYRQLETLRHFGAAMVERAGITAQVRDRHLAHFAVEVARVERRYWGSEFGAPDFGDAAAWYEAEWDNLRAALNHAIDTHNPGQAAAIVAHSFFYALYGMRLEHYDWAQRANAVAGAPPLITAICAAWAFYAGDHEGAEVLARQVLQGEADPAAVAHAWHAISQVAFHSGKTRDMSDAIQQYRNAANDCEDNPALAHHVLAYINATAATLMNTGDAERTANELRELADRAGNPIFVASAKIAAGLVAVTRRDREAASRHFEQGADLFAAVRVTLWEGMALVSRAIGMPLDQRNEAFRNAIRSFQRSRSWMLLWVLLESLGIGWATQGRYEPAAVLLGAIDSRQRHAAPLTNQRDRIQTSLGAHADFGTWAATGAQMTIDELIDYALAHLDT